MQGTIEVQKIRKSKIREGDEREFIRRDPKRDKSKEKRYDFQRNQKRGDLIDES